MKHRGKNLLFYDSFPSVCISAPLFPPISNPPSSPNFPNSVSADYIPAHTCFFSSILYGGKTLLSFEMHRGYTRALRGFSGVSISGTIIRAHLDQSARHGIHLLLQYRPDVLSPAHVLSKDAQAFKFVRNVKFGKWHETFVPSISDHVVQVSSRQYHRCTPNIVIYKDIRKGA